MKLKLLKQVEILEYKFKLKWNKETSGGSLSFKTMEIMVGTRLLDNSIGTVFMVLMHELSEAIHIILSTRYDDGSVDGNYKFFLDHEEFENHNSILSETISKFII